MPEDKALPLALGEVLIAVAWSDGVLEPAERERLTELLFRLPELTPALWERLQARIDQPVDESQRNAAIESLHASLESSSKREQAGSFLDELAAEDSPFGAADRALAIELLAELQGPDDGFFSRLGDTLRATLRDSSAALRSMLPSADGDAVALPDLPEALRARLDADSLHRLRSMGGLLARVVHAKGHADQRELDHIRELLVQHGRIEPQEAEWVLELVVADAEAAMDTYALSRAFFEFSDEAERIRLLDLLFDVAYADGEAEDEEVAEIRRIRHGLLLSHRHFADARVRARQRREA